MGLENIAGLLIGLILIIFAKPIANFQSDQWENNFKKPINRNLNILICRFVGIIALLVNIFDLINR